MLTPSLTACQNPISDYYKWIFVLLFTLCLCIINQAKWKQMPVMLFISGSGYAVNFAIGKKLPAGSPILNTFGGRFLFHIVPEHLVTCLVSFPNPNRQPLIVSYSFYNWSSWKPLLTDAARRCSCSYATRHIRPGAFRNCRQWQPSLRDQQRRPDYQHDVLYERHRKIQCNNCEFYFYVPTRFGTTRLVC